MANGTAVVRCLTRFRRSTGGDSPIFFRSLATRGAHELPHELADVIAVTKAAGFDLVRAARRRGVHVTCGITPAHLLLSDNASWITGQAIVVDGGVSINGGPDLPGFDPLPEGRPA